jgi:hypothetical protein
LAIIKTLPDRLRQMVNAHAKPEWRSIRAAIDNALADRLATEDSGSKTAVVLGGSAHLARILGLHKTRILSLPYPDFTMDNLALLSGEYDFIIADRMLHLSDNLEDAGRETVRVLRPGGWFVHTGSPLDFSVYGNLDPRRLSAGGLRALFPHSATDAGGTPLARWVVGQKNAEEPDLEPTVMTRQGRHRWYRFRSRPARLGVMTMIRNEAPYLLEWIAHYRVLGFERIVLYDNFSNDASARILQPLARAGVVDVVQWRDRVRKQRKAFNNARRRLTGIIDWCLFVDPDEFLVIDPGLGIEDLLPKDRDVAGVVIPWRFFGSSNLRNRGTELTIERFLKAKRRNDRFAKSLVRLSAIRDMHVHAPRHYEGRLLDLEGNVIPRETLGPLPVPAGGPARLHHYFTRSWEEFEFKRRRGRASQRTEFRDPDWFNIIGPGDIELTDALRLAPAVKQELARLRKMLGNY